MSSVVAQIWLLHAASRFCHQDPIRSFGGADTIVPFCIRCSGFYGAFGASMLLLLAMHRRILGPLPSLVLAAAFSCVMALDALFWPTSNPQRYATGILAGAAIGLVALPLMRSRLSRSANPPSKPASVSLGIAGVVAVLLLSTCGLVPTLVQALSLLSVFGFAALLLAVNVLGVGLLTSTPRVTALVGVALFLIELSLLLVAPMSSR